MSKGRQISTPLRFLLLGIATAILFVLCLCTGAVEIPLTQVFGTLFSTSVSTAAGAESGGIDASVARTILVEARLPLALTALFCGMSLAVAGLLLQTTFRNPLAGPSILGVSTGASLGVAVVMMGAGGALTSMLGADAGSRVAILTGAVIGSASVILLLLAFSSIVKSSTMLLIVGIMIGYLASALVSWLNFFAPSESVKGFAIWGMGSFMGVNINQLPLFAILSIVLCASSMLLIKPLNAMLLGDRYTESLGYNPRTIRTLLLLCSGLLTATATAYCGPVGFIGLAVPHIARILFSTSHHAVLMPATLLSGGAVGLLCAWMCVFPGQQGVLPLSAVTPIVGVPVIIYVILVRKRLNFFT